MKTPFAKHDYQHLSDFVRAYLHEDFKLEHGSVEGAADDFRKHAKPEQLAELAKELHAFMSAIEHVPFPQAQSWWTRELGSAWLPSDKNQIEMLLQRFSSIAAK